MRLLQTIKLAVKSIRNNKLRSILTMIGIIIGISSVIILVSMVSGSAQGITSQIRSLGPNLITVNVYGGWDKKLSLSAIEEIRSLSGVDEVAPTIPTNVTLKKERYVQNVVVTGTTSELLTIRGMNLSNGRFISDLDHEGRRSVAVLGAKKARELFGFANPVGGSIELDGNTYFVIGTLEAQGSSMGNNIDEMIMVPLSKAVALSGSTEIKMLYIRAESEGLVNLAVSKIDSYLGRYFQADVKVYSVTSQKQLLETLSSITGILTMMLGGIAAISLIVGGIGVMNVMLVSVSERTKEIGIRKALGGKKKDILIQFLIEALVISSIGGILGVLIGMAGGKVLASFGIPMAYSLDIILISFSFSLVVGIVFGIVPAYKASKLGPIDALRYE